jgi:hypothetical protein
VRFTDHVGRVSPAQAEDCVSQVFLWLWTRKAVLRDLPGRAYLFTAALHRAASFKVSAWTRHVLAMDPEELIEAEEAYAARQGLAVAVRAGTQGVKSASSKRSSALVPK